MTSTPSANMVAGNPNAILRYLLPNFVAYEAMTHATVTNDVQQQPPSIDIRPADPVASSWNAQPTQEPHRSLRRGLVAGDTVAVAFAWVLPSLLPGSKLASVVANPTLTSAALSVLAVSAAVGATLLVLAFHQLYLSRVCSMRTVEVSRIARAAVVVGALALIGDKIVGEEHLARNPVLVGLAVFMLVNVWRMTFSAWLKSARKAGRFVRPVLLVGADDDAHNIFRLINSHPELGYRIVGLIGKRSDVEHHDYGLTPYLGEARTLSNALELTQVKGALVAGGALGRRALNESIRVLLDNEVHIHLSTGINGIDHRRMHSQALAYEPMVYVERIDNLEGWQLAIKRVMDVTVAGIVLLATSPVLAAAAFLIKRHDGGPVFFSQERVGRHGKTFTILKFRSMVTDAEAKLVDLRTSNVRQGPLFKMASDPRVTPIGRILRATSIDELPQLINVLRGDMSLVGPRPALPSEVAKFNDNLQTRHNVLPGITGLWQVEGRDNPDFSLYERFDIFYVENWSVALDISILMGTIKVVTSRAWRSLLKRTSGQDRSADSDALTVVLD